MKNKVKLPIFGSYPWDDKQDCCFAFCYFPNGKSHIIKGKYETVSLFLKNSSPVLVHYAIYSPNKPLVHAYVVYGVKPEYVIKISGNTRIDPITGLKGKHQRKWITIYRNHVLLFKKSVREIPRKWMTDFNLYVGLDPSIGEPKDNKLRRKLRG